MEKFISGLSRDYFLEPKGEPDAYMIAMPKKEDQAMKTIQQLGMNTAGVRAVIGGTVRTDMELIQNRQLFNVRTDMELIQNRQLFNDKSRGCYLSHMKVYHDFLKTGKEIVLVTEEDAVLTNKKEFDDFMRVSKKMMTKDTPMISFAGLCWPKFGKEINNTGMHEYKGGVCTHGFLINRKAAQVLLNKPMDVPIDIQITRSNEIVKIIPNRFVLEQASKDSKKSSWTKVTNDRETKFPPKKTLSTGTDEKVGNRTFLFVCIGTGIVLFLALLIKYS